jgi:hypothetical protein
MCRERMKQENRKQVEDSFLGYLMKMFQIPRLKFERCGRRSQGNNTSMYDMEWDHIGLFKYMGYYNNVR